jgi:hypothetical protein
VQYVVCCVPFFLAYSFLGAISGEFRLSAGSDAHAYGRLLLWAAKWSVIYSAIWWVLGYLGTKIPTRGVGGNRARVKLLAEAEQGRLSGLLCPNCGFLAVEVWFSHPAENVYRTWFICAECAYSLRALNIEKPDFYTDERLRKDLEAEDLKKFGLLAGT